MEGKKSNKLLYQVLRLIYWFLMWGLLDQILCRFVPFAGPIETLMVLWEKMHEKSFYIAVFTTFWGIAVGFFGALVIGTLLGFASYFHDLFDFLMTPVFDFFRYIPMISFTLIAIIWWNSSALAFEVSIFLSLPVIYKNTLIGLKNSNQHYLKRVREIKMPLIKKMIYLYQPVKMPEYIPGCHRALNMCWKSGIIAQLLGNTRHSIGSMLVEARDSADMAGIFAWTMVIVGLSIAFEWLVISLLSTDRYNAGRVRSKDVFDMLGEREDVNL